MSKGGNYNFVDLEANAKNAYFLGMFFVVSKGRTDKLSNSRDSLWCNYMKIVNICHCQFQKGVSADTSFGQSLQQSKIVTSYYQGQRAVHIDNYCDYINESFPQVPSHYYRKKTLKEYLEGTLNVTKIYQLYQEK